ncbi:hypothetical protein [Okeania sp. SIO2C2]|nr:hypothetical protein [Okeania sp. SIO2C2]
MSVVMAIGDFFYFQLNGFDMKKEEGRGKREEGRRKEKEGRL